MIRFFAQFLVAISFTVFAGFSVPKDDYREYVEGKYESDSPPYPDHISGPFTGGFGEETCHSCHFDYDINDERGSLNVEGLGETYVPGEQYELTISVESERLEVGGFQMTARFENGSQAGDFTWSGDQLTLTPGINDNIQYLQHSSSGTRPTSDRKVSWVFIWEAAIQDPSTVIFNIAANAGNDDFSAFGDWIYVKEITVKPGP